MMTCLGAKGSVPMTANRGREFKAEALRVISAAILREQNLAMKARTEREANAQWYAASALIVVQRLISGLEVEEPSL